VLPKVGGREKKKYTRSKTFQFSNYSSNSFKIIQKFKKRECFNYTESEFESKLAWSVKLEWILLVDDLENSNRSKRKGRENQHDKENPDNQ
jgi:hypothetical protein